MSTVTPRRSTRVSHTHTPKMVERKKSLFQADMDVTKGSLTQHRRLPVVESESDPEDCDLGIISTLDSSSGDEQHDQMAPKTPERSVWPHHTRSHTRKLLKENSELKNFIRSPFTLNKYQTINTSETQYPSSSSTPVTPHLRYDPNTPSSTHSCGSLHTTSSTNSRARKSLASLIADTESCSSSLKDLNFDSDSNMDSKENTPTKTRRSLRKSKVTPKLATFRGILSEQTKNSPSSPAKLPFVCLTKMDISNLSPTQMLKTPQTTTESKTATSPPKINRKPAIEIEESPEFKCDSEKSHKRLRNDSICESAPSHKYPKLDNLSAPRARLSLFNSDKFKEILSTKSFYGKKEAEITTSFTKKLENAIKKTKDEYKRHISVSQRRGSRKPGQINLGVKHKIRKPKLHKGKIVNLNRNGSVSLLGRTGSSSMTSERSYNNSSMLSQNSSQEIDVNDRIDPFVSEKQTIEALLSQWEEDDLPASELAINKPQQTTNNTLQTINKPETMNKIELPCFNSQIIAETEQIFQPVCAVQVSMDAVVPQSGVIVEIGGNRELGNGPVPTSQATAGPSTSTAVDIIMQSPIQHVQHRDVHGDPPRGLFLPVEGGYLLLDHSADTPVENQELPDLDAIEKELAELDQQILEVARGNNMDGSSVLASTDSDKTVEVPQNTTSENVKLFPIFSNPNPGTVNAVTKPTTSESATTTKRCLLKSSNNQYVIDAGQKKFGATQCGDCGVIYEIGDPQDEHDHLVHHNATDVLRFNGWKSEQCVGTYDGGRVLRVRGSDSAQWKRVHLLLERVVHPQLGFGTQLQGDRVYTYTAFLYIEKRQIIGCLIAEPKSRAYKLLPGDPDCCSTEDYPVKCGISRIWVHLNHRRRGIARRLLECVRASCHVASSGPIGVHELAFSAPTPAGKALASRYCGTENFYVYLE